MPPTEDQRAQSETEGETPGVSQTERQDLGPGETPEALKEALRKERERTKALEKATKESSRRLQELEEAEEQRKAATLSQAEKDKRERDREREEARQAKAQIDDLKAENRRLRIAHAVYIEASDKGFEYPQDVFKLIDHDRIVIDEESDRIDPKSVKDAVENLAKARSGLLKARSGFGTPSRDTSRRPAGGQGEPIPGGNLDPVDRATEQLIRTGQYTRF